MGDLHQEEEYEVNSQKEGKCHGSKRKLGEGKCIIKVV